MSAKKKILEYASNRSKELKKALENPDIPVEERAAANTVLRKLDALVAACQPGSMIIKLQIPAATRTDNPLGVKNLIGKS
jgi:hypothetical protein